MNQEQRNKESLLRNSGFQTIIGSLLCIMTGLLIGYLVLLMINPGGAGKAIVAILKNFPILSKRSRGKNVLWNDTGQILCPADVLPVRAVCVEGWII